MYLFRTVSKNSTKNFCKKISRDCFRISSTDFFRNPLSGFQGIFHLKLLAEFLQKYFFLFWKFRSMKSSRFFSGFFLGFFLRFVCFKERYKGFLETILYGFLGNTFSELFSNFKATYERNYRNSMEKCLSIFCRYL